MVKNLSDFQKFCVKGRWFLLIGGFFLIGVMGIGLVLIIFGILGFVWKSKKFKVDKFYVPKLTGAILLTTTKNKLSKCPVCKSKLKKNKEGFSCSKCESSLTTVKDSEDGSPLTLELEIKNEKYKDNEYNGMILPYYDWYYISEKDKPSKEYLIEAAKKGNLSSMGGNEITNEIVEKFYKVNLSKNEKLYFYESVGLAEPRSARRYGGGTVRVAKGVYLHTGRSKSHEELTDIDSGDLAFTNKRLIFIGNHRSYEIPLNKILDITEYSDAVKVSSSKRVKPQYYYLPTPDLATTILKESIKKVRK